MVTISNTLKSYIEFGMKNIIKKLNDILTKHDKKFLVFLVLFSIVISIIETIGISIIMPFMTVASDFSLVTSNEYYSIIYRLLDIQQEIDFVILFGISLIFFYLFRSGINLLYIYMQAKFTQGRYYLIVYRLFENYLGMNYKDFVKKNSSTLTKTIINEANGLTALINAFLVIFSEIFVIVFIYSMMLYVNVEITLLLTVFLILNAIALTKTITVKIKQAGKTRAAVQKVFYEVINKTFGNFKLIKLQNNDKELMKEFLTSSSQYMKVNILNSTLGQFPRLFLEAIAFGIIVFIITFFIWKNQVDIKTILPVVSLFVLSLYRLMPSVNRIMTSYNQIMFHQKSLELVHNDLIYDSENLMDEKIGFGNKISLESLNFEYEVNKLILKDINLIIQKGSKIAFVGESGSGKSTLVDLIIGLYKPCNGKIKVDTVTLNEKNIRNWRSKIGYIPQSVYLFDGTVGDNITFGFEYNEEKVDLVLKKAKIYDFLQTKEGQNTFVGEGGIMLSGGQKQRIAIARALYSDPEILVLDEATSALDDATEKQIMDEIYNISDGKTLIIIAHRLSTLSGCDKIYKIENGKIIHE